MKILLIFWTFSLISGAVNMNIDVTGYTGGNLLLDSGRSSPSNARYLRKQINGRWNIIIDNNKQNLWINEGRFNLFLKKDRNIMLFIRELKASDTGRYKIGLLNSEVEIDLTVISDSCCVPKTVEVRRNQTAVFSCEYSQNHRDNPKIILKVGKYCIDEIMRSSWKKDGKLSLFDKKDDKLMRVIITAVTPDDGGVYLCGVWIDKNSYSYSVTSTVHLHIMDVLATYKVTGYSGAPLMIKCEHPQHKTKPKYICKESDGCSERKSPRVRDQWVENGDVSLYDDTGAGVLMVFFRELKDTDGGRYRCGVNESDYTERFTELQLNIRHDPKYPKSTTESVHLGGEINITCQIPEEHKLHFCKEDENHICRNISSSKVSETSRSSERNEERVLSVSFSNVSVRDAGVYWCGAETRDTHLTFISLSSRIQLNLIHNSSMILLISVCVILLLITGFALTVCKLRHRSRGRNSASEKRKKERNTASSCSDSRQDFLSDPGSAQINSHDDIPTIPSDEFPYAVVDYQRHEESLSDTAVAFSKDPIHSAYATVSHRTRVN